MALGDHYTVTDGAPQVRSKVNGTALRDHYTVTQLRMVLLRAKCNGPPEPYHSLCSSPEGAPQVRSKVNGMALGDH
jgi:hypothetical protein